MPEGIHEAAPIASALVIGIGGSGVQTLARLRSAVRDHQPSGQVAMDNVKFLAIDSGGAERSDPGASTGHRSEQGRVLQHRTRRDERQQVRQDRLAQRRDPARVLGCRPATQRVAHPGNEAQPPAWQPRLPHPVESVQDAIRTSLNQVLSLAPEQMGWRQRRRAVAAAGLHRRLVRRGTGSSGFLHVLHAVHRAAGEAGVSAQVYPVLFLPDVFAHARDDTANPAATTRGHWANAYAFFAELDHVLTEPQAFDDLLCPAHALPTNVETVDVVKAAFLIDGRLTDGGQFDGRTPSTLPRPGSTRCWSRRTGR